MKQNTLALWERRQNIDIRYCTVLKAGTKWKMLIKIVLKIEIRTNTCPNHNRNKLLSTQ